MAADVTFGGGLNRPLTRDGPEASESQVMLVTRRDFPNHDDSPLDVIQRACSW